MKKITLVAALLGVTYVTNAQVGIGTSQPALSSQLEIASADKGVLIPRVNLTDLTVFAPIGGTAVESLLVYNTGTTTGTNAVTPGFYYWVPVNGTVAAHWERIVNQTQLEEAISNITDLQGDLSKVLALLKVAFPANNLVDPAVTGDTFGGGMVFTPATTAPAVPAKIEYVYFDGTNYTKKDITTDIINIIKGAESKTVFIKTTDGTKQYYISEDYLTANSNIIPAQSVVDAWATLPTGVYQIDIIGGVSKNIQTILDQTVTITEDGKTFTTVEQYIQYIASKGDANVGYTVAGITAGNNNGVAIPANSFYYINQTTGDKVAINLASIVKQNETKTKLITIGTKQYYVSENYTGATDPTTGTEVGVYEIDFVDGIVNNFNEFINSTVTGGGTNYTTVEEYIEYISQNVTKDGETRIVIDTTVTPNQASFEQWNGTAWAPVATTAFSNIVKANQTVTTLTANANGTYTYKNEAGADVIINIPASVIQNLDTIINAATTFTGSTSTTLVQYIQEMIDNTDLPQGMVTASITGGNISFNIVDVNGVPQPVPASAFSNIVKANETLTAVGKSTNNSAYVQVTTDAKAAQKIVYEYMTENTAVKNYIDVTADVEWSIENNTDVKNAIEDIINNLLNQGGNVYFTRTAIAAGTPLGQLAIPAFSFYTVNETTGLKEIVDIAQTIVNAITNATTVQKQEIKNQLGDNFFSSTVVNTGDTWIDGGKVYKGIFAATVAAGTANVSDITLTAPAGTTTLGDVISIKILDDATNTIINTATTDVTLTGTTLSFKIGTGNMYNVLSATNLSVKVVVEFSAQ